MEWHDLKDLLDVTSRIQAEKRPEFGYARIVIDLGHPDYIGTDIPLSFSGDQMAKVKYTGSATGTYFRLNNRHAQQIFAAEFRRSNIPFTKIYLTNPTAQTGKVFTFFVGTGIFASIQPSTGGKGGLTDSDGADINPAEEEHFISHTGGHMNRVLATADTAEFIIANSLKVRWAMIGVEDYDIRWGFGAVARVAKIGIAVSKDNYITLEFCDLSKIKFVNKNAGAGELPALHIEYIAEA